MACSCIRLPCTGISVAKSQLSPPAPSSCHVAASFSSQCGTKSPGLDLSAAFRMASPSSFSGDQPSSLYRSRSAEMGHGRRKQRQVLRKVASADFQLFGEDDEFLKNLEELALGGNPGDFNRQNFYKNLVPESAPSTSCYSGAVSSISNQTWELSGGFGPAAMAIPQGGITSNCELPASMRLIKQKKKQQRLAALEESFREVGESARCSVDKAFSSMVFMIRELQSYTIHMRQGLFYEDMQQILSRVQQDMNASFVWLFQQIFSGSPTLMVSVMLLLANFTVYSMTDSVAMAAPMSQPKAAVVAVMESNTDFEQKTSEAKFDQAPAVKTFSSGREASIGGSSGSGGKVIRPVAGSTDDGRSGPSSSQQIRYAGTPSTVARDEDVMSVSEEDEEGVWNNMVGEARQMQASFGDESLVDPDVLKWMVNSVTVQLERDDYIDYTRTDLDYQLAVQMDPQNSLLLANFAHFLQVVVRDHKRAEYFYKKAIACVPADGEAFSKYANFLWLVKNDTEAAEENFLEALIADSGNSYIAASYAHFLWNTGGTDTCFAG